LEGWGVWATRRFVRADAKQEFGRGDSNADETVGMLDVLLTVCLF
jgi:hypothetical protein